MKKLFSLLTIAICCLSIANAKDVLYLNNGSIIKGELVEVTPDSKVSFSTSDGNLFVYEINQVKQITKDAAGTAKREVLYLKNGSVIKGKLTGFVADGNATIETSDGSVFVYAATEVAKIEKDVVTIGSTTTTAASTNAVTTQTQVTENKKTQISESVVNRHLAPRGYRGFADLSLGGVVTGDGAVAFEISTTHGVQLSHHLFVGGGIGIDIWSGYYDAAVSVPIYAALKGNVGSKLAQFTWGTRVGMYAGECTAFLWNVNAGLRLGFTPKFALQISPDISFMTDADYFWARIGVRVGVEF